MTSFIGLSSCRSEKGLTWCQRTCASGFYFRHPTWKEKNAFSEPRGGPSRWKRGTDCGTENAASKKPEAHLRESEMPAWKSPADRRWKVLKMCEKHLKRRCLADVSHNASSSSDMASCLSPYSYVNAQSGWPIRKCLQPHFFFQVFPSNQFTLERDKSLKSHIRGEGEQMVIWAEKRKGKKIPRRERCSVGIAG